MKLNRFMATTLAVVLALGGVVHGNEAANQKLKEALGDNDLVGPWVYNDLEEGLRQARKTGKPLLLVYRCVT